MMMALSVMALFDIVTVHAHLRMNGDMFLENGVDMLQHEVGERSSADITLCVPVVDEDVKKLPRLLDSVLNQTVLPREIILEHGGDHVSEFTHLQDQWRARKISPNVPLHIYSTARVKSGENRNRCAGHAQSPITSFIDADDLMHPRRLEIIQSMYQQYSPVGILHGFVEVKPGPGCDSFTYPELGPLKVVRGIDMYDGMAKNNFKMQWPRDASGEVMHIHFGHITVNTSTFSSVQQIDDGPCPGTAKGKGKLSDCEDARFVVDIMKKYGRREDSLIVVRNDLSVYCRSDMSHR